MSKKLPSVGKWAEDKLELLKKYLGAYTKIMDSPNQRSWLKGGFHYIDAFAGPGYAKRRDDEKRLIEGSPVVALKVEPAFWSYHFIEISSERIERLKKLEQEYPNKSIKIYKGDANLILREKLVLWLKSVKRPVRAFIFLDPYGLQVEWKTVEFLGSLKGAAQVDIFVNFPLMGIHRAALPTRKKPDKSQVELLKRVIGSKKVDQVIKEIYAEKLTLFPEDKRIEKIKRGAEWLADIYRNRLISTFSYVSNAVIMRNSKNAPLYALMLASHNGTAVKIINDIFEKYEKERLKPFPKQ